MAAIEYSVTQGSVHRVVAVTKQHKTLLDICFVHHCGAPACLSCVELVTGNIDKDRFLTNVDIIYAVQVHVAMAISMLLLFAALLIAGL